MYDIFRSTERDDLFDDEQGDVYFPGQTFELSGTVFELLEALASYDETELYDVCVLRFAQNIDALHWSIYLQSQSAEGGPVYDVYFNPDSGRWGRKERKADQVTYMSSVWPGRNRSRAYRGATVLGTVDSIYEFESIVRSTPLPSTSPGRRENCQSWVENVIRRAVNRGLLDSDALHELRGVPKWK
jgi:hypothetical protein